MKKFLLKLISWERMKRPKIDMSQNQERVRESRWSKATRGMDLERDAWIDKITGRPPKPLPESGIKPEVESADKHKGGRCRCLDLVR